MCIMCRCVAKCPGVSAVVQRSYRKKALMRAMEMRSMPARKGLMQRDYLPLECHGSTAQCQRFGSLNSQGLNQAMKAGDHMFLLDAICSTMQYDSHDSLCAKSYTCPGPKKNVKKH